MAKKKDQPTEPEENSPDATVTPGQKRWYWIRTVLLTILIFVFVIWYAYPENGNSAILWAAGLSLAILGYFALSYYKLYR